jgi:hypothetical protein
VLSVVYKGWRALQFIIDKLKVKVYLAPRQDYSLTPDQPNKEPQFLFEHPVTTGTRQPKGVRP